MKNIRRDGFAEKYQISISLFPLHLCQGSMFAVVVEVGGRLGPSCGYG